MKCKSMTKKLECVEIQLLFFETVLEISAHVQLTWTGPDNHSVQHITLGHQLLPNIQKDGLTKMKC